PLCRRRAGEPPRVPPAGPARLSLGGALRPDPPRRTREHQHAARRLVDRISRPCCKKMTAASATSPLKSPRVPVTAAVVLALGWLVARKPWALFTPQLWAEDGTIHLNHNDEFGAGAFLLPYR